MKNPSKLILSKARLIHTLKCPHCGKEGGKAVMRRWHFDNCKIKNRNHEKN